MIINRIVVVVVLIVVVLIIVALIVIIVQDRIIRNVIITKACSPCDD